MTTPIENCPQPETPIRERAYASGQERVAEDVVDRVAKAIADAAGHGMREKCEKQARAAIAALAQNAQADVFAQAAAASPKQFQVKPAERARVPAVVREVMDELEKAIRKFPTWPTDPLHAVGVFNEEAGELSKAVLQQVYEPHKNKPDDVRKEAQQAAAMALRFLVSLDSYDWTPGVQHDQPTLADALEQSEESPHA
jgi:hypothetical protein